MTILNQIAREVATLPAKERRHALQLIHSLKLPKSRKTNAAKASAKSKLNKRKLHPALRAIAGMWKDRTDLPKDGVEGSKVLRGRLMGREKSYW